MLAFNILKQNTSFFFWTKYWNKILMLILKWNVKDPQKNKMRCQGINSTHIKLDFILNLEACSNIKQYCKTLLRSLKKCCKTILR